MLRRPTFAALFLLAPSAACSGGGQPETPAKFNRDAKSDGGQADTKGKTTQERAYTSPIWYTP